MYIVCVYLSNMTADKTPCVHCWIWRRTKYRVVMWICDVMLGDTWGKSEEVGSRSQRSVGVCQWTRAYSCRRTGIAAALINCPHPYLYIRI